MNSSHVKASVACYFRYKRQYPLVCFERSIDIYRGNPDILTIDNNRHLIEIEVKVSVSDMKNDAKKRTWKIREIIPNKMPYQFYYAVPIKMQTKALNILKEWKEQGKLCGNTGLLIVDECKNPQKLGYNDVYVVKKAPLNKEAPKLSLKQIVQMVKNQTGTLCSLAVAQARSQLIHKDLSVEYYI